MIPDQRTRVEQVIARMQAGLAHSDNGSYAAVTLSCEETKTLLAALAACGTPPQEQIEALTRERDEARDQFDRHVEWASKQMTEKEANLSERVVQLIAHRACHSAEHDPLDGRIHGYCMVCGVPWPCAYAGTPPKLVEQPTSDSRTPPEAPAPRCNCALMGEQDCPEHGSKHVGGAKAEGSA